MTARIATILVGVWLILSAILWRHLVPQFNNAWICGALVVALGVLALNRPTTRWLLTLLSLFLVISTLLLPWSSSATVWNNLICAAVVFIISLAPQHGFTHRAGLGARRSVV